MSELVDFVRDALRAGKSREEIRETLLQAGWRPDETDDALRAFADVDFPVPVPKRRPRLSARDAFLHLLGFLTLYISAISLGTLLFQFINLALPDPLQRDESYQTAIRETLRGSVACLVVAFPVFLLVNVALQKGYREAPALRASPVRRWLTYFTLFVAAAVLIAYLISLVHQLLSGEFTVRFLLKVVAVAGITGSIFAYYRSGLRPEERSA